jgi:hypothetical protein
VFLAVAGCEKEKIVESTEYIHDIEYIELPPDTVLQVDTVFVSDSTTIYSTDTIFLFDTVVQIEQIYDTLYIHDTVTTIQYYYDTTFIVDTITLTQCAPNEYLALTAMQYYCDPLVIDFVNAEFGLTEGWILYLSAFQLDVTQLSSDIYDIYGYIDYWTIDWSGYYPLEFYWRITYVSGDPADPTNWQLSDPPSVAPGHQPGIRLIQESLRVQPNR